MWDLATGKLQKTLPRTNDDAVLCVNFNDHLITAGTKDHKYARYRTSAGGHDRGSQIRTPSVAVCYRLLIWDARTFGLLVTVDDAHDAAINSLALKAGDQGTGLGRSRKLSLG